MEVENPAFLQETVQQLNRYALFGRNRELSEGVFKNPRKHREVSVLERDNNSR